MKLRLLLASLFISGALFAQQDPQFTQNMFNKLYFNPAYAGSGDGICGTLLGRYQWVGFEKGEVPETQVLSVHAPFNKFIPLGVGLNVYSDQLGRERTIGVKGALSYRQELSAFSSLPGVLSAGIGIGIINKYQGAFTNTEYINAGDPLIPNSAVSETNLDFDFGVYYQSDKLNFGISSTHLNSPDLSGAFNYDISRHYYLFGGYQIDNILPNITLEPSLFAKTTFAQWQVDLNVMAIWNNQFFGGLTYRFGDAAAPMFGIIQDNIAGGTLKACFSYDVGLNSIYSNGSSGSYELSVGYCKAIIPKIKVSKHHTVRFL